MRMKMWNLTIRIKKNDQAGGKRLEVIIMDLLLGAKIDGATAWAWIRRFRKTRKIHPSHRRSNGEYASHIEVVDEQSKLEPLLPELKRKVVDNGLLSVDEVHTF